MIVSRDFNGLIIPTAQQITVLVASEVQIMNSNTCFATVYFKGNLIRVEAKDFDAIGLSLQELSNLLKNDNKEHSSQENTTIDLVWQALKDCYDPEIPVNIVDLGLIYGCSIVDDHKVIIKMALTSPKCGMGPILIADLRNKILNIKGIKEVEVEIVCDPPWSIDRISGSGKITLGLI